MISVLKEIFFLFLAGKLNSRSNLEEEEEMTNDQVIQKTGGFSDVFGMPQRNLIPQLFVVRHSRALGQS